MKIKLLKPLPGAEVGTIGEYFDGGDALFGGICYRGRTLIETGWAEEINGAMWWNPKISDDVVYFRLFGNDITDSAKIDSYSFLATCKTLAKYGLCKRTQEELETTLLLLKLRQSNGGWKPNDNEEYFSNTIRGCTVMISYNDADNYKVQDIILGNSYRTREEAEKYAPEWKKLFDSVK